MARKLQLEEIAYRPYVSGVDRDENINPSVLRQICTASTSGVDYDAINDHIDRLHGKGR